MGLGADFNFGKVLADTLSAKSSRVDTSDSPTVMLVCSTVSSFVVVVMQVEGLRSRQRQLDGSLLCRL
jgi:hypothetical protein